MKTPFGSVIVNHSPRGIATFLVEVFHDGLHKHSVLRAGDPEILANKSLALAQRWNTEWEKQSAAEQRIRRTFERKEARRLHVERQKEVESERTAEAQQLL